MFVDAIILRDACSRVQSSWKMQKGLVFSNATLSLACTKWRLRQRNEHTAEPVRWPADYEIYAGEELKVVDTEEYDAEDFGTVFGSPGSSSRYETGFLGTALMGAQPGAVEEMKH